MIVFPAIDIQNGRAVRLRQGVKDDSTTYFDNPVEAAVKWADEGALFLHVVDLDGAFPGASLTLLLSATFAKPSISPSK